MKTASPLRYPGGKSALANVLKQIRQLNNLGDRAIAEPFAGGAGASLALLFEESAPEIYINDRDSLIRDFWWSITQRCDEFIALLKGTRINMTEWRRQRDLYRSQVRGMKLERGFATFYLNRCNRSGVIFNGGPIGGIKQLGKWKLNARFNKVNLITRCKRVADYGERINVSGLDGIKFIRSLNTERTFFFHRPAIF
jgi:DNA adenine methylase